MEKSESPETKRIHAFQLVAEKIEGFQVGSFFFYHFFMKQTGEKLMWVFSVCSDLSV